jgi:cytochrome c biogenesis protein CcmG/thiol:disulfide interchange protein DsbE
VNVWDSDETARRFLDEFAITYPNGPDPHGSISIDYGLTGIPETFFIDRKGQITRKWIGPFPEEALRAFLDEIVGSGD